MNTINLTARTVLEQGSLAHADPRILNQINAANIFHTMPDGFSASLQPLRPAVYAIDQDMLDDDAWLQSGKRVDVQKSVVVANVQVYKDGVLYCTLPDKHPIYIDDAAYIVDLLSNVTSSFQKAFKDSVIA